MKTFTIDDLMEIMENCDEECDECPLQHNGNCVFSYSKKLWPGIKTPKKGKDEFSFFS